MDFYSKTSDEITHEIRIRSLADVLAKSKAEKDGSFVISSELAKQIQEEINTPFSALPEKKTKLTRVLAKNILEARRKKFGFVYGIFEQMLVNYDCFRLFNGIKTMPKVITNVQELEDFKIMAIQTCNELRDDLIEALKDQQTESNDDE